MKGKSGNWWRIWKSGIWATRILNIHYALLTDLPENRRKGEEQDPKVELAVKLIDELNRKYSQFEQGEFFLFHRHRIFNPQEGAWMGWERKRGKLLDLNKVLRKAYDPFPVKTGNMRILKNVRFVITLDSDTQLPRGVAARMIGTMAHPLNAAVIDAKRKMVTEGYGSCSQSWRECPVGQPIATGGSLFRSNGFRHLHSRGVGCISGPVWRRHFHREGDL